MYTKPSSIKLEVYLDKLIPKKIDTVDLEIPGTKVKTITSCSRLLREKEFSENFYQRRLDRIEEIKKEKKRLEESRVNKEAEK